MPSESFQNNAPRMFTHIKQKGQINQKNHPPENIKKTALMMRSLRNHDGTGTAMSLNKIINKQDNGCARAL